MGWTEETSNYTTVLLQSTTKLSSSAGSLLQPRIGRKTVRRPSAASIISITHLSRSLVKPQTVKQTDAAAAI